MLLIFRHSSTNGNLKLIRTNQWRVEHRDLPEQKCVSANRKVLKKRKEKLCFVQAKTATNNQAIIGQAKSFEDFVQSIALQEWFIQGAGSVSKKGV